MAWPVISFLSDYGLVDEFVGVCHGVIAQRCPAARVIDISHGVPRHDVRAGALLLRDALPHMPAGVHLAMWSSIPVGALQPAARRQAALACAPASDGRSSVGPDNGKVLARGTVACGIAEAIDVGARRSDASPYPRPPRPRHLRAVLADLAAGAPFNAWARRSPSIASGA